MTAADTERVGCAWCKTALTPEDAKPIKYARIPGLPDTENMQCRDTPACQQRQDALDAVLDAWMEVAGAGRLLGRIPARGNARSTPTASAPA